MKTTIKTLSLALLLTPMFACADAELLADDAETGETGGTAEDDSTGDEAEDLSDFAVTVNGSADPEMIERASVVFIGIEVESSAFDAIEFYADDELLGVDTEPPFESMWIAQDDAVDGIHQFAAVAIRGDETLAADAVTVEVDLPEPGTKMWTLAGGDWAKLASTPGGLLLLGDEELVEYDADAQERWRVTLPFPATVVTYDYSRDDVLIAGVVNGGIEIARLSPTGQLRWMGTVEGSVVPELVLEDLVIDGSRIALTGRIAIEQVLLGWVGEVEVGLSEANLVWTQQLGKGDGLSFVGGPAYDEHGQLYVPATTFVNEGDDGWIRTAELCRYEAGEQQWRMASDGVTLRVNSAVVVANDGSIHLASFDDTGGAVTRYDAEGEWLSGNAGIGDAVTALANTSRGVVWAGNEAGEVTAGRIGNNGTIAWMTTVEAAGEQGSRDLAVDHLGYVYVLSNSPTSSVIHRLHP